MKYLPLSRPVFLLLLGLFPATATSQLSDKPRSHSKEFTNCQPSCRSQKTRVDYNMWHGMTPLVSTRADVERLVGNPITSMGNNFFYKFKSEKINVVYSGAPCDLTQAGRWNVSANTLLILKVYPQTRLTIEDLNLDLTKYVRGVDSHIPDWVYYINREAGISIEVSIRMRPAEVMSIEYQPKGTQQTLRCPDSNSP